jgi:hypothetical protein
MVAGVGVVDVDEHVLVGDDVDDLAVVGVKDVVDHR